MPLLSRLTWVGIGKETTQGTAVTPTLWIPTTGMRAEDLPQYTNDESIAGNNSLLRNAYLGEEDAQVVMDGFLYPEVIGFLFVAAGFADTVTGTNPYTHTFKQPTTGAQPPSYTLTHYNQGTASSNVRQYAGAVLDQLDITLDAKGPGKWAATFKAWPSTTTAKPAQTWSTSNPLMGWENAVTIGGSGVGRIITTQFSVKRQTEAVHTQNNTRNPYSVFAGPVDADWRLKAVFENETDWLHIMNNDQPSISMVVTSPTGSPAPVLTLAAAASSWQKAPLNVSGKWEEIDIEAKGFYNSGDQGPGYATLLNGTAAAY